MESHSRAMACLHDCKHYSMYVISILDAYNIDFYFTVLEKTQIYISDSIHLTFNGLNT